MASDDINVTAKPMARMEAEEYLAQIQQEFLEQAELLENEANAAQREMNRIYDHMMLLRARASSLRMGVNGVGEALERFAALVKEAQGVARERESVAADRDVPSKSGYSIKIPQEYR